MSRPCRLPGLVSDRYSAATTDEVNALLAESHYLGPVVSARWCFAEWIDDEMTQCQVWRWPTARMLPADGSWLELSRWCITPTGDPNAGSRMLGWVRKQLRKIDPAVQTLVSYSDPVHGHSGGLYRASGWTLSNTHHGVRFLETGGYPSGHGSWDGQTRQHPKQRWIIELGGHK